MAHAAWRWQCACPERVRQPPRQRVHMRGVLAIGGGCMLRFRPSYANVTSTLALVLALCGGAYAAGALPVNSVGSKQLKKNAVVGAKIARGAVDGSKVRDKSLTTADIKQSFAAPNATHASSSAA